MIVSRTPLRVSLAGGGSDIPSFYTKSEGSVISFTINKHVYIVCHSLYSGGIRLSYSRSEFVQDTSQIMHPLFRESLAHLGLRQSIEIGSFADVPSSGTGLGSSSAFTVGLLHAVAKFTGRNTSAHELAEMACDVELKRCKEPIGKQDQFAAAYGGINHFKFLADDRVLVNKLSAETVVGFLESTLMLFDLGSSRKSNEVLFRQNQAMEESYSYSLVRDIRDLVDPMINAIKSEDLNGMALVLNESWSLKRKITSGISNEFIDELHSLAMNCGALAAKVLGAGGGGFLLVILEPGRKLDFCQRFTILRELPFKISQQGSTIIFSDEV